MDNKKYLEWAITKDRSSKQYQELANRLNDDKGQLRLLHSVMGLSGEVGELTDAVKKTIMYNKPLDVINVIEEAGDILWYMSLLLDEVGSSFEEAMKVNHDKLEKRFPTGFTEQLAQERRDKNDGN